MNKTSSWQRQRAAVAVLLFAVLPAVILARFPFWLDSSVVAGIFALMALSVGIAYGQAGVLTLAAAAFSAIGAYITAILTTRMGWPPLPTVLLAVLVPALLAYPIARSISRLSPLALTLATLMIGMLIEIVFRWGGELTGGYVGISGVPSVIDGLPAGLMHCLVWATVAAVLALYRNLVDSPLGRAVSTARHDPLRATADGVNVPHVIAVFFSVSAAVGGLAGWLYAQHFSYIGPDSLTTTVSIQVLLMAIIGGARSLLGPVIGASILIVIKVYLPSTETLGMVFGFLLIVVLLTAPNGLLGTDWRGGLKARRAPGTASTTREDTP